MAGHSEPDGLDEAAVNAYRSALRAIGRNALLACPASGVEMERKLTSLDATLAHSSKPAEIEEIGRQAEGQMDRWGTLTAEHLKRKADEVKELLIMLAGTAESVGERDQRYTDQFGRLTIELKAIAHLDDLTSIRSSLVRKAAELRACIDKMTQEGQRSLAELRSRVSSYETRLKVVEELASRDPLTGLANRRSIEGRMEWYAGQKQTHCIILIDLNDFKAINDKYGHAAGDDLLKKFSDDLQKSMRATDVVARWGGDEFIVLLSCNKRAAQSQVERIRRWVLGKYTIQKGDETFEVNVEASIGVAQWGPGKTGKQVIEEADGAMYRYKQTARIS